MTPPFELPADIAIVLAGREWQLLAERVPRLGWVARIDGHADLLVRAEAPPSPGLMGTIADEVDRLVWAAGPVADAGFVVPEVVAHHEGVGGAMNVLVTTLPVGESDLRLMPSQEDPLRVVAEAIQRLEAIDPADCPFTVTPEQLIGHVEQRVQDGAINIGELHDVYSRSTPQGLVGHLRTMEPQPVVGSDAVVVHGGVGFHSLRVDPVSTTVSSVIGWSWCGVGDRHYDLAVASRSVMAQSGTEAVGGFFDAVGQAEVGPLRLEFYGLIDELR